MERRRFIKKNLLAASGVLFGAASISSCQGSQQPEDEGRLPLIETISQGNGKNILVLMSAGYRKGNTDRLTDAFIKGLVEKGHRVTKVYLGSMRLAGCRGCGACRRNGNRCAVQDDMQKLYPLFEKSDTIVMASPLYFWTITAKLKSFVERLYSISVNDRYPEKDTVLLMTSGDNNDYTFDQALSYYRIISGVLGGHDKGVYLAGGCTGCEEIARNISLTHLDKVYEFGLTF